MRFYRININDPKTGELLVVNAMGKPGFSRVAPDPLKSTYTSLNPGAGPFTNGGTNPNALQITLDIPTAAMHLAQANNFIKIDGVGIAELNQASNLTNLNITVYGGMAKGLPLANPAQSGILAQGQIQRSYGNRRDFLTDLTLIMYTGGSSPSSNQTTANPNTASSIAKPSTNNEPANIVFVWKQGQRLIDAMINALVIAFPKYKITGSISENLVWSSGQDAVAIFATLAQFAEWIHDRSLSMLGGYAPDLSLYSGVSIAFQNNTITIYDGSTLTTPKPIQFNDLIGQPAWLEGLTVQAVVCMRGDIQVGDFVTLPPAAGTIESGAPSNQYLPSPSTFTAGSQFYTNTPTTTPQDSSIFQGTFHVSRVRHVGQSRDPNGMAWITVLDLDNFTIANQSPIPALPTVYTSTSVTGYYLP
jgi:hypothetical protein